MSPQESQEKTCDTASGHVHGPMCGHPAVHHEGHVGYIHDGHLHCIVHENDGKHVPEGKLVVHSVEEVIQSNPTTPRLSDEGLHSCQEAVPCLMEEDHAHGPDCGHERVQHQDHYDYLVGEELHHPQGDHCHHHGKIQLNILRSDTIRAMQYHHTAQDDDTGSLNDKHHQETESGYRFRRDLVSGHLGLSIGPEMLDSIFRTKAWHKEKDAMRFMTMLVLTSSFFFIELIVGLSIESLSLVSDAFHMLSDVIALIVGFVALRLAKTNASNENTFGYSRAEVVGALVNATFLLAMCFSIILESIHRFIDPVSETLGENTSLLLWVAVIGLAINVMGLFIFGHGHDHSHGHSHGHSHDDTEHVEMTAMDDIETGEVEEKENRKSLKPKITNMNIHGVFLHVLGDALGSIAVIISSAAIRWSDSPNRFYADPICSVFITLIILASTLPLLKQSILILLQSVPKSIDLNLLSNALSELPGVIAIHELHVWQLNHTKIVGSLHVVCDRQSDFNHLSMRMKLLCHEYGLHATTIQPEFVNEKDHTKQFEATNCVEPLCGSSDCIKASCCAPPVIKST